MRWAALYLWMVLLGVGALHAGEGRTEADGDEDPSRVFRLMGHEGVIPAGEIDRWFAKDKAQHVVSSLLLTGMISYHLQRKGEVGYPQALWIGSGMTIGLGILKECRDLRKPYPFNRFSLKDLVADLVGVGLGIVLVGWWP